MKKASILNTLFYLMLLVSINLNAQESIGKLLPSEALTLMKNEVDKHPEKKRIDATKPFMLRVITDGLSREEQFYLGDIYFWNFMPQESLDALSKVKEGKDEISRAAWQRIMQINFRAFEKHDEVEKLIPEFRKLFKPNPKDLHYMFDQVNNLGIKYAKEGNHEKVLELINQELNALDYNGAYKSFLLPAYFFKSYKALGKEENALALLEKIITNLENILAERVNSIPKNDPDYLTHSSRVDGMETIVTNKLSFIQMNSKYEKLIKSITKGYNFFKAK